MSELPVLFSPGSAWPVWDRRRPASFEQRRRRRRRRQRPPAKTHPLPSAHPPWRPNMPFPRGSRSCGFCSARPASTARRQGMPLCSPTPVTTTPAMHAQRQTRGPRLTRPLPSRNFLSKSYPAMKKQNPHTPILIREASGIEPKVYARFGASQDLRARPIANSHARQALERRSRFRSRDWMTRASRVRSHSSPSPTYRLCGEADKTGRIERRTAVSHSMYMYYEEEENVPVSTSRVTSEPERTHDVVWRKVLSSWLTASSTRCVPWRMLAFPGSRLRLICTFLIRLSGCQSETAGFTRSLSIHISWFTFLFTCPCSPLFLSCVLFHLPKYSPPSLTCPLPHSPAFSSPFSTPLAKDHAAQQ